MKHTIILITLILLGAVGCFMTGRTTAKPDKMQYLNLNAIETTSLHNGELTIVADGEEYILYIEED